MRTSAYITHKMRVMRTHSTIYELGGKSELPMPCKQTIGSLASIGKDCSHQGEF
jgi:hypothetical protein